MSTEDASIPAAAAAAAAAATATDSAAPPPPVAKKEKKKPPEGLVIPPKKPKPTKAERRALQEQQRAAKAGGGGGGIKAAQPPQQPSGTPSGGGGGSKLGTKEKEENKQQPSATTVTENIAVTTAPVSTESSSSTNIVDNPLNNNSSSRMMSLVSHLKVYPDASNLFFQGATLKPQLISSSVNTSSDYHSQYTLHPAVIRLGYQYATGKVRGGNDRCRAMLSCFKTVLSDYIPPSNNNNTDKNINKTIDLRQALDQQVLKPSFQFWTLHCRHHSVSMGNAFTFLKTAVSSLERDLDYTAMRDVLLETMQQYADERIDFATRAIADLACTKLLLLPPPPVALSSSSSSKQQGTATKSTASKGQGRHYGIGAGHSEVILTYGYSEVISVLLRQAAQRSKANNKKATTTTTSFRVIVVDSRPHLQGRRMLEELRRADIDCTYILLNALTYVLNPQQESTSSNAKRGGGVTKVLLGAAALMSDGSVLGSIGTACVALCAHDRHVPVLVCCETYKISNRVQLDSLTNNELSSFGTHHHHGANHHHHLNLSYDLTPATFVSGIVTELGIVPPTSVAVLLREMNPQGN